MGNGMALIAAIAMIPQVMNGVALVFPGIPMRVDMTNWIVVFGITLISFLSSIYNIGSDRGGRLSPILYDFFLLFLVSIMVGLVMFEDLFWIYLLVETTVGVSVVLVAYAPGKFPIQAAFKYLIMTAVSALFFLIGVLIIYWLCETTDMSAIVRSADVLSAYPHLVLVSVACFIVGLGADLGIPPFHGWLPDAFPASTPAVNSFACAESICLLFTLFRLVYPFHFIYPSTSTVTLFFFIGIFSIVLGASLCYGQRNFWRLAAYVTVDGYGHAALAFGLFTAAGFAAGQFYLVNGALMKMVVLQSLGAVSMRTGSADMTAFGGLSRGMKKTAFTYLICALSLGGVPPLSGFYGKMLVYSAVFQYLSDNANLVAAFSVTALLIAASVVSLTALMRGFHKIFLGNRTVGSVGETQVMMWLPSMLGAGLGALIGVYPSLFLNSVAAPIP